MQRAYKEDPVVMVWWTTEIECVSALARLERGGDLTPRRTSEALERLDAIKGAWVEVQPLPPGRSTARRLLRVHDLRAADALQLAAALIASEDRPETLAFVTLDSRLAQAASREGLVVEPTRVDD
jgi:predicted nucleic acid-binding protein